MDDLMSHKFLNYCVWEFFYLSCCGGRLKTELKCGVSKISVNVIFFLGQPRILFTLVLISFNRKAKNSQLLFWLLWRSFSIAFCEQVIKVDHFLKFFVKMFFLWATLVRFRSQFCQGRGKQQKFPRKLLWTRIMQLWQNCRFFSHKVRETSNYKDFLQNITFPKDFTNQQGFNNR